jgi:hypothetical protein
MNWLEINLLMKFAPLVMQKYYHPGHSCMTEILRVLWFEKNKAFPRKHD